MKEKTNGFVSSIIKTTTNAFILVKAISVFPCKKNLDIIHYIIYTYLSLADKFEAKLLRRCSLQNIKLTRMIIILNLKVQKLYKYIV